MTNLELAARKLVEALENYGTVVTDLFGDDEEISSALNLMEHELGISPIDDPQELREIVHFLETGEYPEDEDEDDEDFEEDDDDWDEEDEDEDEDEDEEE